MQAMRFVFAAVAVLFVAGVVMQFFLAGMAVFGAGEWLTHGEVGYGVAALPLLLLLLAWPARVGRRLAWLSVAAFVVAQVQTTLPLARESLPVLAALHPVNALLVFGVGLMVARRAIALAAAGRTAGREPAAPSARPASEKA